MESFRLGYEWDLIFLRFVSQTIQNIFETWIFKKIWKKSPKLFIILASHMESFILGSECWKSGSLDMDWLLYINRNVEKSLLCALSTGKYGIYTYVSSLCYLFPRISMKKERFNWLLMKMLWSMRTLKMTPKSYLISILLQNIWCYVLRYLYNNSSFVKYKVTLSILPSCHSILFQLA
jgi:hypothetical protein